MVLQPAMQLPASIAEQAAALGSTYLARVMEQAALMWLHARSAQRVRQFLIHA
jgi:hypothetical protein